MMSMIAIKFEYIRCQGNSLCQLADSQTKRHIWYGFGTWFNRTHTRTASNVSQSNWSFIFNHIAKYTLQFNRHFSIAFWSLFYLDSDGEVKLMNWHASAVWIWFLFSTLVWHELLKPFFVFVRNYFRFLNSIWVDSRTMKKKIPSESYLILVTFYSL